MRKRNIRASLFAVLGVAACFAAGQPTVAQGEPVWEATGLMAPESAVYNATSRILYVSNINGGPTDMDGAGRTYVSDMADDAIYRLDGIVRAYKVK